MAVNNKRGPKVSKLKTIEINQIIRDYETLQTRNAIDPKTVEQYARSMRAGAKFPPVKIFDVDGRLFLVDGFHRVAAAEMIAQTKRQLTPKINAEIISGAMEDAIVVAALCNITHGKALKRSDHRKAFRMLANSGVLDGLDSRSIADKMNNVVTHVTIWSWAKKDFPGLLAQKGNSGEKPDANRDRLVDPLSAIQVEHQAAISSLHQTMRFVSGGKITDKTTLDTITSLAKQLMDESVKLGGDSTPKDFW